MSNDDNRKELNEKEKLALTGFTIAARYHGNGSYVTPKEAWRTLVDKSDPNVGMLGSSMDVESYAEELCRKGYMERGGMVKMYRPTELGKDAIFKRETTRQD